MQFSAPIGMIIPYAGADPKAQDLRDAGWFYCNGGPISTIDYPDFAKRMKVSDGQYVFGGNASPNINLPDLRGTFVRGVDDGANLDPDRAARTGQQTTPNAPGNSGPTVGSIQTDIFTAHTHTTVITQLQDGPYAVVQPGPWTWNDATITSSSAGGNETRPKNVYLYYLIYVGDKVSATERLISQNA